jgi:YjbE family integral membrane protein
MDLPTPAIDFASPGFWLAVLQIIWIDVLLSGDNAVVIALACRDLPPHERFRGMAIGASIASLLLIALASIAFVLLKLPYLQLAGGTALLWIAVKLLAPQAHEGSREAAQDLWRAVRIMVLADIVMSLDNVIAVAAIAKGQLVLLIVALAVSIPIVFAGSAFILRALQRFPILVWGGAAILGSVAGDMLVSDPAVSQIPSLANRTDLVDLAAAVLGAILVIASGAAWRAASCRETKRARNSGHNG